MVSFTSNIGSLKAQRQLNQLSSDLATTFERLSSGLRINKASDDAAGLAIATALNADERIMRQGVRNLNDGISLLNIAEGAIQNLGDITIRLQELAEQAANGTYSYTQRAALNKEAQALSKEFARIAQTTSYNGVSLFDGSLGNGLSLQAGMGAIQVGVGGDIGTGTFQGPGSTAIDAGVSVQASDLNGDGVMDLVNADYGTNTLSVFLGIGDGSFQTRVSYATGGQPFSVEVADFNGDGVMDLVSADSSDNRLSVFLGNGNGSFQTRISYATGTEPFSVDAADFNGDGVMDLVSADHFSETFSIFYGNGNGTFQARVSYANGASPYSVQAADFNNDGVMDLVSANELEDTLAVFLGDGNGSFQPRVTYLTGGAPYSVQVADFNGDDVMDLVSADYYDDALSVRLGNGDGSFQARVTYATGTAPTSVAAGDFNGDGQIDLVSADFGSNTLSVLLGNGNGSFQARLSIATVGGANSVQSADFNGDGVMDLVGSRVHLGNSTDGIGAILPFDLTNAASARQALSLFSNKQDQLNLQSGLIGSYQSRLRTATNVLSVTTENFNAARSRIMDADIAMETGQLVRQQILQQAATAVLAQANQQPALALRLLGNTNS